MEPTLLLSCPNWIFSNRSQSTTEFQLPTTVTDISSLNMAQWQAYDIVSDHNINQSAPPLRMMVLGTAGTGKSFLISCIAQLLLDKCLLTGTTGIAGFNINGITIHSALRLPIHHSTMKDLTGMSLATLQNRLKNITYIITDKLSMLGQRTFACIDQRLRQASGKQESLFGGFSLILIGDFAQLPPVGDRPLYATDKPDSDGHILYRQFDTVVILTEMVRQNGADLEQVVFRDLLLKLQDGESTEEDWQILFPEHHQLFQI